MASGGENHRRLIDEKIKSQLRELEQKQEQEERRIACSGRSMLPSQQQIKQNKYSSMRSDERRSTYCSQMSACPGFECGASDLSLSGLANSTAATVACATTMADGGGGGGMSSSDRCQLVQARNCSQNSLQRDEQLVDACRIQSFLSSSAGSFGVAGAVGSSNLPSLPPGDQTQKMGAHKKIQDAREEEQPQQSTRIQLTCNINKGDGVAVTRKPMKKRENWDKNIEFLLAVIGFAVDLGNVWRFPYICYKNGGGAFLIPYTVMFILGGLPIFYLEMSLGQYFSSGCLTVWRRVCPMAKGIGYAMCVLNFFTGLYYNTIISWAVFFFVESFTYSSLPWTSCNNLWNSKDCKTIEQRQESRALAASATFSSHNQSMAVSFNENSVSVQPQQQQQQQQLYEQQHFSSPTKDYFEREVLQIHLSSGIDDLGSIRTPLALYLAIVFVCIYFAIWKGVKSTGKAVWITALLPYFVLIPLLIRGVFLEGAPLGIKYYLYPDWIKILNVDVWVEAAKQIYFSLGPGFGTLMALSSYNKFNHNCRKDALIAASVNYFASFISGLVIFAVLGYMATIENVSIEEVATEGPGLVFQVYPEGLATMRFSALWSVLFFMMVITLGIDSTELEKYQTLTNGKYAYPGWAPTVGLLMTGSSVCCVPIYAIYYLKTKTCGTFLERLKSACTPIQSDDRDGKDRYADALTDKIRDHDDIHLDTDI